MIDYTIEPHKTELARRAAVRMAALGLALIHAVEDGDNAIGVAHQVLDLSDGVDALMDPRADTANAIAFLLTRDCMGAATPDTPYLRYSTTILTAGVASENLKHYHLAKDVTDFTESVQDVMNATLVPGANINIVYNDVAGTITVSAAQISGTNLGNSATANAVTITSDTGNDTTIQAATPVVAGVMTAADKSKLIGIQAGAQVNTVTSVAGKTGTVLLTKADVGLGNVDNTSDATKPVSGPQQIALDQKANLASLAAVALSGLASDLQGVIPSHLLPALAINETFLANGEAEMLALAAQPGDFAVRNETNPAQVYMLFNSPASTLANWVPITIGANVLSVNGKTGAVVLTKADLLLDQVNNTSDLNKPISNATAAALLEKSDVGHTHVINWGSFTGNIEDQLDLKGLLDNKADINHDHVFAWGMLTGTLADQTDLWTILSGKSDNGHTHTFSAVVGLQDALDGKAAMVHGHLISHVSGLDAALEQKAPLFHSHSFEALSNAALGSATTGQAIVKRADGTWGAATLTAGDGGTTDHGALTGLGDDDHTQYHNDQRGDIRYYTRTQIDQIIDGHQHPSLYRSDTAYLEGVAVIVPAYPEGGTAPAGYPAIEDARQDIPYYSDVARWFYAKVAIGINAHPLVYNAWALVGGSGAGAGAGGHKIVDAAGNALPAQPQLQFANAANGKITFSVTDDVTGKTVVTPVLNITEHSHTNKTELDSIDSTDLNNWDTAYNRRVTGVGVSGTTSKTVTITRGDGSTVTGSFSIAAADVSYTPAAGTAATHYSSILSNGSTLVKSALDFNATKLLNTNNTETWNFGEYIFSGAAFICPIKGLATITLLTSENVVGLTWWAGGNPDAWHATTNPNGIQNYANTAAVNSWIAGNITGDRVTGTQFYIYPQITGYTSATRKSGTVSIMIS